MSDQVERLDRFLAQVMPDESRTRLSEHIASGGVRVDGVIRKASYRLRPGSVVEVASIPAREPPALAPWDFPLNVVYEDEWLLVVDKPAGLSVHPSGSSKEHTLVHALLARSHGLSTASGGFRPGIVHRLDKDTSGLLLVAKTDSAHRLLQRAIYDRKVNRIYWAWVRGRPRSDAFEIRSYLGRHPKDRKKQAVLPFGSSGARLAVTHCRLLCAVGDTSLIECKLETGRTHQIRVHLASVGLRLLGDTVYGVLDSRVTRQALHARYLSLQHPITKTSLSFTSEIPEDLRSLPVESIR